MTKKRFRFVAALAVAAMCSLASITSAQAADSRSAVKKKAVTPVPVETVPVPQSAPVVAPVEPGFAAKSPVAAPTVPDDVDALADLLQVLDEETEIATKTKLNIDFVPGMVTVLHGSDLRAKGVRTVYDALGLVPGIELSMTGDGQPQFLVRGLGKTFASAKIKFLLNGMDMNSTLGPNIAVHSLPIEQVERIEVVRGPGSAIYGEHALAGVVDITTIHRDRSGFMRYGDVDGYTLGGVYSDRSPDARFGFDLNVAGTEMDAGVKSGADSVAPAISNAPGESNARESNRSALLNLYYDEFTVVAQHVRVAAGDHFGVNNILPAHRTDTVRTMTFDTVEVRRPWRFGKGVRADLRVGWTQFEIDVDDQQLYPAGYDGEFLQSGVLGGPHYEETRSTVKTSFEFTPHDDHHMIAGVEYADVVQGDTWNERNYNPALLPIPGGASAEVTHGHFTGAGNWLQEGLGRTILSAYIQDEYTGRDELTVTAGLRIDRYDDVGDSVTPRIAAVYQLSDQRTVKVQYSDSFRPPSFLEMYTRNNPIVSGNPDIKPERMHTLEAGYIHNYGDRVGRITAFISKIEDIVLIDSTTRRYINGGRAQIRGVELEAVVPLKERIKLDANAAFNDSDTSGSVNALWGASQVHANVGAVYQLHANRYANLQYRYVGERNRETGDTRSSLESYQTIDFTFSAEKIWRPQLGLRAGIRNLLDVDVAFPAPKNTYPGDYPRPGRHWWFSAAYKL